MITKDTFQIYYLPRSFLNQIHTDNGAVKSTCSCFLSSDASFVVAAEETITRSPFWRANFAILEGVTLGNVITVEHGRVGLSSTTVLVSGHVTLCLDA